MSGSVNKVIIIGRLGADPEIKSFSNGGKIANLRVATSERWNDRQTGERREKTEWHSVSIKSDGLVGTAERFLKKGSNVYIEGKLETRKWQDQSGNNRYSTEIVLQGPGASFTMLDSKPASSSDDDRWNQADGGGGGYAGSGQGGFADDMDDDCPFVRIDHSLGGRRR